MHAEKFEEKRALAHSVTLSHPHTPLLSPGPWKPSKQVLTFGRKAAVWLPSMGTTVQSSCVRCMTEHHTSLTQPLNCRKGGEVMFVDTFALDLLYFM